MLMPLALFLGRNILIVPYYKLETFFFGKLNGVSHETKCIFNSSIQEFQAYLSLFFFVVVYTGLSHKHL